MLPVMPVVSSLQYRVGGLGNAFVEDVHDVFDQGLLASVLTRAIRGTWHFKLKHGVRTVDTSKQAVNTKMSYLRHGGM
jgi:hypothetical protein